jgi:hypothetical protein
VNDSRTVSFIEGIADLDRVAQRVVDRQGSGLQSLSQRLPFEEFEDEEVDVTIMTDVVQHANVWVIERGN